MYKIFYGGIIFLSIYIICLIIYALKSNTNNKYLYNITFNIYSVSIIMCFLFILPYYDYMINNMKSFTTGFTYIFFYGLFTMLFISFFIIIRFIKFVRSEDKGINIAINNKQLNTMLKDFDNIKYKNINNQKEEIIEII